MCNAMAFDLAILTLTFRILSGPYLRNWCTRLICGSLGTLNNGVGMINHGVTFNLSCVKVC